jgi:predicted ATPase
MNIAASLSFFAGDLAILGFLDQATNVSQEVVAWAQGMSRPLTLLLALVYVSLADQFRGDVQAAEEHSASALGMASEYRFPHFASVATVVEGWARGCRGQAESGIVEMRRGISGLEATGVRTPTFLLVPLAETYVKIGQPEEASRLIAGALETAQQTGQRLHEAELYRLKGELLLKPPCNEPEAETCFQRAIEIARGQSAKWWELRATSGLARLLAKQGRRDEARAMLAEIYNWFTEGFDTADLKDAKALLDELSG